MLPLRDNVPTRSFPVVTVTLIIANVLVFLVEASGSPIESDIVHYGFYPCTVHGPCVGEATQHQVGWLAGAFTSMFMHADIVHIGGNMLFLWIFGNNVEDSMGRLRFLVFYLAGGLTATALQTVITLHYAGPAAASIPNIGASGAISAVLGAYFVLLPQASVLTLIIIFVRELPAFLFLGFWFLFQAWQGSADLDHPPQGGGVAVFAHIGGFLFGLLLIKVFQQREPLRPRY